MPPHLIKVKHQVKLTHVPEKRIQHLDEKVYSLEVRELVVVRVDAGAEEEPGIPPVNYLGGVAELDEVGLVLLVAGGDEAVDLVGRKGELGDGSRMGCWGAWEGGGAWGGGSRTSPFNLTFSSSCYRRSSVFVNEAINVKGDSRCMAHTTSQGGSCPWAEAHQPLFPRYVRRHDCNGLTVGFV